MVVDRFFIWVAEATAEQKLRAVEALVAAFVDVRVSDADREAIEAALLLVADDPDLAVRRRLAECLAEEDGAPRHLLLTLLDDHPSVAVVVAAGSEALIDAELVDLVAHGPDEIRRAVAGRRRVGPTVAVALAEAGERATCVALLDNGGAVIPPIALERVVERFGEFSDVRRSLLARPHVPITVRHRVLERLAEAIENLVVVKSWMGRERAAAATAESRDKATVALAGAATGAETVVLVEHLRRTGRLTTRLMLRAACVGDLRFVEEALALLADVPSQRVAALIADGRENALRGLYRRAAMPDRAWPAFHAAIEVHRELLAETGGWDGRPGDRARFARRLVERVLTRFTAFERRDADDLLVLLRRYAADAAREHVRHVMAERMAGAGLALAAPVAAEATDPAEAGANEPDDGVRAAILDAVAAELGVTADEPAGEADASAALSLDFAGLFDAPALDLDPAEGGGGLFDHVRLEDLPADWRLDEVPPEALWSDEDIVVRHSITPDGRFADNAAAEVPALDGETAATLPFALRETVGPEAGTAAKTAIDEPARLETPMAPLATETTAAEAVVSEIAPSEAIAAETLTPEAAPEVVVEATVDPVVEATVEPAAAPADPFFAELEAALDAVLGPLGGSVTRRAA